MTEQWVYDIEENGKHIHVEVLVMECHLPNLEESIRVCRTYKVKEIVETGAYSSSVRQ